MFCHVKNIKELFVLDSPNIAIAQWGHRISPDLTGDPRLSKAWDFVEIPLARANSLRNGEKNRQSVHDSIKQEFMYMLHNVTHVILQRSFGR